MPPTVIVNHRPELMATEVYVYRQQADPPMRWILLADGAWQHVESPGEAVHPTFVLPDDVVPHVLQSIGMPMSDAHLLESLRHERQRVDRMVDAMTEAVTRGL